MQANIRKKIAGEPMEPMHPWFKAFGGTIDLQVNKKGEVSRTLHVHVCICICMDVYTVEIRQRRHRLAGQQERRGESYSESACMRFARSE